MINDQYFWGWNMLKPPEVEVGMLVVYPILDAKWHIVACDISDISHYNPLYIYIISHFSPWYPHDNQWYFHFLAPQNSSRSPAPFFRSSSSWTARKIKGAAGRVQRLWMNVEFQWVLSMDWWEHRKPWFLQSNIGFAWSNFPIIQCYDFKCELNV